MQDTIKKRGGYREGKKKKKGVKFSDRTAIFTKRITPEEKIYLEECLENFRKSKI